MTRTRATFLQPSLTKVMLWTLASGVGTGLGTLLPLGGLVLPILSIVPCTVLQGLLMQRWCGLRWYRWALRCSLWAIPAGLLATVLMIPALFGAFEPKHAMLLMHALALVYGAGLGIGGAQAVKPLIPNARGWIPISALAWMAGLLSMRWLFATLDPSGGRLWRTLRSVGISDHSSAWGVSGTQQLLVGLTAGLVSASLTSLLLSRTARGAAGQRDRPDSRI